MLCGRRLGRVHLGTGAHRVTSIDPAVTSMRVGRVVRSSRDLRRQGGRARALALSCAAGGALVAALAACGSQSGQTSSAQQPLSTPSIAARPTPDARALVALLDHPFGAVPNTLRLVRSDGVTVASTLLPDATDAVAMAGRRVLIATAGVIEALDDTGAVGEVERLAAADPTDLVRGIIASPDGATWLWTVLHRDGAGNLRSRVYLGAAQADPRLVLEHTDPDHALTPLVWSPAGPVVAEDEVGIGGYILFRHAFGAADRVDLKAGALVPVAPADCALSDLAADGTVACVTGGHEGPHGAGPVTLRLLGPQPHDVPLSADIAQAGAALFSPDGRRVTLASSPAVGGDAEQIATEALDLTTLARIKIGAGLVPAGWLDTSTIVAVRQQGFAGGDPGTYLLHLDGMSSLLSTSTYVVGLARSL